MKSIFLLTASLFLLVLEVNWKAISPQPSVEICDNGIDDDGDGLIDLNDSDCFCPTVELVSLIPNPSFEDQNCCPRTRSKMDCATTWIQASAPTTDYIHTCDWLGWENLPMPLPIPDGEGAVGFRDGRFNRGGNNGNNNSGNNGNNNSANSTNPNFKEYAGACLLRPLRAGFNYKFRFWVGFTNRANSPPINITFFGTPDCDNLPFGNNDERFGCPTNGPGWNRLGAVYAAGENEWKQYEIDVTPTQDIYAMTIGPPCQERSTSENPYYFFDNLILAEESAFEFDIQASTHPCADEISLVLPQYDTIAYQWFKDGVALVGETNATLKNPPGNGEYLATLASAEGCTATQTFNFQIPVSYTQLRQTICENDPFLFNNQQLMSTGIYLDTLTSSTNCDSIIQLQLTVDKNLTDTIEAKIFPNETYHIGKFKINTPGLYERTITSSFGCDSTVNLTLGFYQVYVPNVFSPNGDGINDFFTINGGEDLTKIRVLTIFDRWGNEVFNQSNLNPNMDQFGWNGLAYNQKTTEGVYLYTASLLMDDGIERTITGQVTLIR